MVNALFTSFEEKEEHTLFPSVRQGITYSDHKNFSKYWRRAELEGGLKKRKQF